MDILMLETVVRPTPKGMFVGNLGDHLVGADDEIAQHLIDEGKAKAAAIEYDAIPAVIGEPAEATLGDADAPEDPAPAAAADAAPKNKGGRPKKADADAGAAAAPEEEAPAA